MKILINGLQLGKTNSGVQYYTQHLFENLNRLKIKNYDFQLLQDTNIKSFNINGNRIKRILAENLALEKFLRKNQQTLYHSPNYVLPFFFTSPSVLTIHDLITLDYPQLCQTETVIYFRFLIKHSIKKAQKIIAVSNTVKKDIINHFNIPENKIEVVYHGVSPLFRKSTYKNVLEKYNLPEKYILFVGNIEPKKNLERLIKAFSLLRESTKLKHKLVITGKKGWKSDSVFKTVEDLGLREEIIFTGYFPEQDLPKLYSMSDLFVFPSIYEGFGIPPLEAMACETPVLASNRGALPETTGGNCLMVDPFDIESIVNGMYRLITDQKLRKESIKKGKEWVKQFTWDKTARRTIEVYKQVKVKRKRTCMSQPQP